MSLKINVFPVFFLLVTFVASENVTTVFQLEANARGSGYEDYGTWRVISRNGARGIPVRKGGIGLSNVWAGKPCCDAWSHEGWTKLSDDEALPLKPPLDLDPTESADSTSLARISDDARQFKQDSSGVWRGTMLLGSRVRLDFIPPEKGRAILGIFLCDSGEARDVQCVAVIVNGASSNGTLLRYQTARYGSRETGSRRGTPNGNLNTHVVSRDDRVTEGWKGNNQYHFRIERSAQGDLEVQLDNGDPSQRRQMIMPAGGVNYGRLAVSLVSAPLGPARELTLREDTARQGELSPGGAIKVNFSPSPKDTGHLGFALCDDRFRGNCSAKVFDGTSNGSLIGSEPAYWTAGSHVADHPIPESATSARWDRPTSTFTLTRVHDKLITITMDGTNNTYSWSVPATNKFLIIDAYHNEGNASVNAVAEKIAASVWKLNREVAELRSPVIPEWYVAGEICVSIVARVGTGGRLVVSVQRYQASESRDLDTITGTSDPTWVKKRIVIRPTRIVQNYKVQIVITARQPKDTNSSILVQWVAGCNPDSREDDETIKSFVPSSFIANKTGFQTSEREKDPIDVFGLSFQSKRHSVCHNEGLINKDSKCVCRPGFTGTLCEKGCGPNRFGEMCESKCSDEFSSRECRGMWLCTPDLPCDCGPGFKGPLCDQPCERGKYGVGCRQTCGICAYNQTCDRYTGWCTTGCQGALLPPFCVEECGRQTTVVPNIVNGPSADEVQYPWHVGIFDKNFMPDTFDRTETIIEQVCGGTLISPNVVVSAAHCFYDERIGKLLPAERFAVAFGKKKRGWNATEKFPERIQKRMVGAVYIPPEYHGTVISKEDDIAVLVLAAPIEESAYVVPACLDKFGGFEGDLKRGSIGYVAGWGRTENNQPSEDLREANLTFIDRDECLELVPNAFRPFILAKDRFCAGKKRAALESGTYVHRGDSGGGLVFRHNDAWFLRGVVSIAPPEDKSISAYTNVSYHRDWIVSLEQVAALRRAYLSAFLLG